ncbi:hypothetical protein E2C01_042654 [Portunus trituberculatus]|uniref:Uncharacterized protein n=1 Tax=Portunus trituberculatus TaxID=210409 RepID=A0A5B7FVD9_PORTR|nr:hypothetical protein [Portunus trituberculatus]
MHAATVPKSRLTPVPHLSPGSTGGGTRFPREKIYLYMHREGETGRERRGKVKNGRKKEEK